jgi:hypothetical protein
LCAALGAKSACRSGAHSLYFDTARSAPRSRTDFALKLESLRYNKPSLFNFTGIELIDILL